CGQREARARGADQALHADGERLGARRRGAHADHEAQAQADRGAPRGGHRVDVRRLTRGRGHRRRHVRALTWNLFHGRSVPPAGRSLEREFAQLLAGWEWEVALLQEVPPWWPAPLARAAGARQRSALTSRNVLLGVRRAIA